MPAPFSPPQPDLPVIAGMDALVFQGTRNVGWATDAGFSEDFHLEPILALGTHGPRGHKSTNYSCSVRITSFNLYSSVPDNLNTPTRDTILQAGIIDFYFVDKGTGKLLYELRGCKCASKDVNIDGGLSRKMTRWEATKVIEHNVF